MSTSRCRDCGHDKKSHKYESGFYDVRGGHKECGVVGCPCDQYRAEIKERKS